MISNNGIKANSKSGGLVRLEILTYATREELE